MLLLLIAFSSYVIFCSSLSSQVSALPGTGIGIRKEGPIEAETGETISYNIIVYNLGDFWIRNITATDTFPNGTSSFWNVPDLAPQNQTGNSFNISEILYTIKEEDVLGGPPPHILNHAEVNGYADVSGFNVLVHANTDYPTLVTIPPPPSVGGYSVNVRTVDSLLSYTFYATMFLTMSAIFVYTRSQIRAKAKPHHN